MPWSAPVFMKILRKTKRSDGISQVSKKVLIVLRHGFKITLGKEAKIETPVPGLPGASQGCHARSWCQRCWTYFSPGSDSKWEPTRKYRKSSWTASLKCCQKRVSIGALHFWSRSCCFSFDHSVYRTVLVCLDWSTSVVLKLLRSCVWVMLEAWSKVKFSAWTLAKKQGKTIPGVKTASSNFHNTNGRSRVARLLLHFVETDAKTFKLIALIICSTPNCVSLPAVGVIRGLSQGSQSFAEGAREPALWKKLRNNSEALGVMDVCTS